MENIMKVEQGKVFLKITSILKEHGVNIDESQITSETDILNEIGIDSITIIGVLTDIESEFGVELDPLDLLDKPTIGLFVKYIDELKEAS